MTSTNRLPLLLHALLLVGAIFLLYRPTLTYGFVWDDHLYVQHNPAVQSWSRLPAAFTSPAATWSSDPTHTLPAWRPLRNLSYILDHTLYGLNPTGYHLTNVILHALTAVLVLVLLRRLLSLATCQTTSPAHALACLIAAALWALHPVQTEIVAWIKSRDDLLATPLLLAALLTALPRGSVSESQVTNHELQEKKSSSLLRLAAASVLFAAALLSKENAIVLAGLYPVILFLLFPSRLRVLASKFWPHSLVFIIVAIAYLALRHITLGRTAQASWPSTNPLHTTLTMLHALTRYAQLTLWPWPPTLQSADYDAYPIITNPLNPRALLGLLILISMALPPLLIILRKRLNCPDSSRPVPSHTNATPADPILARSAPQLVICNSKFVIAALAATGLATTLIALLPYANIIPMMQILAERFLYVPTIGIAILITALLTPPGSIAPDTPIAPEEPIAPPAPIIARRAPPLVIRNLKFGIAALAAIAFSLQTHRRLPVWQSDLTLFTANTHANPTSWRPINSLIRTHLQASQTTAALNLTSHALRRFPRDPDIVRTAALAHIIAHHDTTATLLTQYAIKLQPHDPRASQTLTQWQNLRRAP